MSWHEGPVSAALKGTPNERKVILSRYRQIVEEVSVEDEADAIYEVLKDVDVRIPINVVRPELREELAKRGLKFGGIKGQVAEKDVQVLNEILARINGEEPTTPGGGKPSDKSEGTGADDTKMSLEKATQKEIDDYDKNNGTEFGRFASFVESGVLNDGENHVFHVANTGELLHSYGLNGIISVKTSTINKNRHSNKNIVVGTKDWLNILNNINEPFAITKTKDRQRRLYLNVKVDGNDVCVVVDAIEANRGTEVSNIKTLFPREISKILQSDREILLYPSEEKLKRAITLGSQVHNEQASDQDLSLVSDGKGTTSSATDQTNGEKKQASPTL